MACFGPGSQRHRERPRGCSGGLRVGGDLNLRGGSWNWVLKRGPEKGPQNRVQKWGPKMGTKNGSKNGPEKWDLKVGRYSNLIQVLFLRPIFRTYF